jgi:hypothetical protein
MKKFIFANHLYSVYQARQKTLKTGPLEGWLERSFFY